MDGLREGRHVIGGITIDKNNLVPRVRKHLGNAIETNRGPFVKIIAMQVISAIYDN